VLVPKHLNVDYLILDVNQTHVNIRPLEEKL